MDVLKADNYKQQIKQKALELGFEFFGVAKAEFLEEEAPRLENWLNQQMHGQMAYMANHFDKRLDPTLLVPGAKSVVTLMMNYFPQRVMDVSDNYKIAKYAYGKDYHFVIKDRLKSLMQFIQETVGEVHGRVFVDSAPVMERAWAKKSGMGWIGKNSLLLHKQRGSFFFLAELIIDLDLPPDGPVKDYCGSCTRCMDTCPTEAIPQPYIVDARKCISYLTIELKEQIPDTFEGKMQDWIFGCDICQDVCPWNRFSKPHKVDEFLPAPDMDNLNRNDWQELTEEIFRTIFKKSPVKRTKFEGLKRNIQFAAAATQVVKGN
ncbi:tRNA epoxyqueuosine(34) reductase QueG [Rapidithrix thailandica]|uniref:Epoxyqueuosine reductase n=1 Tax=Rapidithrix thailandica TaxID=413964 RepID=A0AAW9SBK9_9BACT